MQLPELAHKLTARTETRTVLWRAQTNSKIIGLELHDTLQQAEPLPLCPAQCNVATTNWWNKTTVRSKCAIKDDIFMYFFLTGADFQCQIAIYGMYSFKLLSWENILKFECDITVKYTKTISKQWDILEYNKRMVTLYNYVQLVNIC